MTDTTELDPKTESTPPSAASAATAPPPAARRWPWGWLALLIVLLSAGVVGWQLLEGRRVAERRLAEWQDVAERLDARVAALDRRLGSESERGRALEAKQGENQANLRVMREELLGMTERATLLEDTVNRLTAQRESAAQALRLAEIEFLLSFAEQRLQLFADVAAATRALGLAEDALKAIDEPAFAPLKQSVSAELDQLRQLPTAGIESARRRLADLLLGLERLPMAAARRDADQVEQSRWRQLLGQLMTVRRLSDDEAVLTPLERATRVASLRLQLGLALAALEQGRTELLRDSVRLARQGFQALFDADAPAVAAGARLLDELEVLPLDARLPTLGSTLRELRAIRAGRSASALAPLPNEAATPAELEVESQ